MGKFQNPLRKWINNRLIKGFSSPPEFIPSTFSASKRSEIISLLSNTSKVNINCQTKVGQQAAYDTCPIVGTGIERRGDYVSSGVLRAVNNKGEDVNGYDVKQVMKLLENPNPMQDWEEFCRMVGAYYDTFGYCPILQVYPSNRNTGLPVALWPISPLNFEYQLTGKLYAQQRIQDIVSYITYTNPGGITEKLIGEDINRIWIFNGKTFRKEDPYTAQSPLYSASDAVTLFNVGINVYGQLIKQSVLGIISTRDRSAYGQVPMKPGEKKEVQEKMDVNYGLVEGRDKFIITNKDLYFQSLLTNIGNLALPDGFKMSMDTLCDRIGIQAELLSQKDATFENKKNAEISQYNAQTIPYANKFTAYLTTMFGITGWRLMLDYSKISVLQKDENQKADALSTLTTTLNTLITAGVITSTEARTILESNNLINL